MTPRLSLLEKQTLFKLRCRMVHVKSFFKSSHKDDMKCVFCENSNSCDSIEHYIDEPCQYLIQNHIFKQKLKNVTIGDIYGTIDQQTRFVKLWLMIEDERKKVTEVRQDV